MGKIYEFEDGSLIEWVDRETIEYKKDNRSIVLWVDYEPGLFSNGRILRMRSIENWSFSGSEIQLKIEENEIQEIILKVSRYYFEKGVRLRVER